MMQLTEADLRFLVETVATRRKDHDRIMDLVRGKDDLLDPMLEDPRLAERVQSDKEGWVRISPWLLFAILVRRLRHELESESYVYEVGPKGQRLPVFEAPKVVELLSDPSARDYLIDMLCSFTKTQSGVLYWRQDETWRRRKFSDLDMDDMILLSRLVEPQLRSRFYRRIADIALFLTGIFPENACMIRDQPKWRLARRRTLNDYEKEGQAFYELAAQETDQLSLESVLRTFAEQFSTARRALTTLSDRYLRVYRTRFFGNS